MDYLITLITVNFYISIIGIKIVESFWSVDIIDEYYISELILSMLLKIEQEGKEHQIIMLVILLNRGKILISYKKVFNKYKKFVDHY